MSEYIELKNVTGVFVNPTTKSIIVTGIPEPDDESHNCDEMGCTSVEHTIYRFNADNSEAQRLRAALEDIRYQVQQSDHAAGLGILATINQALSITSEPTVAERLKGNECPFCGCEISVKYRGINAPEKEDEFE